MSTSTQSMSQEPDLLALLAAHRDSHSFDSGAQDGFKRYQTHLTRALASLRKQLGVSGKGKVDLSKVEGDARTVSLVLLSAERAYVASLAPVSPTSTVAHSSKSTKQQTLSRLQKSLSYIPQLLALPLVAASPIAVAQATIYQLLIQATRALKRDDAEGALEGFAFGLIILRALEPKLAAVGAARLGEWAERDFEPALRFCAYKLRASGQPARDVDDIIEDFAPLVGELEGSFNVPANVLADVKALPDASAEDRRGGSLSWLDQTRQIQNARLVGALARLATARASLAQKYGVGVSPASSAERKSDSKKGILKAFDRVLLAARSGLDVIDATGAGSDSASGQADEGSSAAFVGDYLAFVQASTLVQRDLHLVHHLLPASLPIKMAGTASRPPQLEARTLVKVVRLLGAIVGQWETIGSLASVERGTRGEGEAIEVKVGWFRAVRLYFLSLLYLDPHPSLNSPPKALALLPVLTLLLRQVSNSLPSADSEDEDGAEPRLAWPLSEADPEPIGTGEIYALEQRAGQAETEAKDQLWDQQETASTGTAAIQVAARGTTFLDLAVNFVDLDLREDLPAAKVSSSSAQSTTAPTAKKPAAQTEQDDDDSESDDQPFDDAQDDAGEEDEEAEDKGPQKKGWLGGWFGRS